MHSNRQQFVVVCYSNVVREDSKSAHLKRLPQLWRPICGLSAAAVADLVREDQIDILVELTGHTAGNRLDVMALKPAPVQVTWIGYPNSTGLPSIDYRLTDSVADPADTSQTFVEQLYRLPHCFLCYTPPMGSAPEINAPPALSSRFVTFGSFNNLAKINSQVLSLWCDILLRVPNSRMLIKCKPFASETVRAKVCRRGLKLRLLFC
jgi:protein O-GlcNAc transferase